MRIIIEVLVMVSPETYRDLICLLHESMKEIVNAKKCHNKVLSVLIQFFKSVFINKYFFLIKKSFFMSFCH